MQTQYTPVVRSWIVINFKCSVHAVLWFVNKFIFSYVCLLYDNECELEKKNRAEWASEPNEF